MSLLRTEGLTVRFGGVVANNGIDLTIEEGQVVGLIGPNGAGKTTFIDAITGYVKSTGLIELDGEDIRPLAPNARVHRGLVRTFQSLELFEDLAVEDNVLVAAQPARWYDAILDMLGRRSVSAEVRAAGRRFARPSSVSPTSGEPTRPVCPRASASSSASPARSPHRRGWCCWTSRRPDWTPPNLRCSASNSAVFPRPACRCC